LFISFDINLKSIFNHYFFNLGHTVFVPQYLKTAQAVLVFLNEVVNKKKKFEKFEKNNLRLVLT
jgi:hypothetical protein